MPLSSGFFCHTVCSVLLALTGGIVDIDVGKMYYVPMRIAKGNKLAGRPEHARLYAVATAPGMDGYSWTLLKDEETGSHYWKSQKLTLGYSPVFVCDYYEGVEEI